jgi:hypothetical protein
MRGRRGEIGSGSNKMLPRCAWIPEACGEILRGCGLMLNSSNRKRTGTGEIRPRSGKMEPGSGRRATRCGTCPGAQPACAARSPTPPAVDGTKLCRCHQQSPLQTRTVATALAPADPGLLDRGHPKPAHLARPPKAKEKRGGNTALTESKTRPQPVPALLGNTYRPKTKRRTDLAPLSCFALLSLFS